MKLLFLNHKDGFRHQNRPRKPRQMVFDRTCMCPILDKFRVDIASRDKPLGNHVTT